MTDNTPVKPDSDTSSGNPHHHAGQHPHAGQNPHAGQHPHAGRHPHFPSLTEIFILNGARLVTSRTILAPLERVQLLLQCEGEMRRSGRLPSKYNGIAHCVMDTYRTEGALSFFRGNLASILPFFLTFPSTIVMDRYISPFFLPTRDSSRNLKLGASIAMGCFVGVFNIGLVYHLDFVRTRLANDVLKQGSRQYSGILDCYRQTLHTDGFRGLYRGYFICCVGHALTTGTSVGIYEYQRKYGNSMNAEDRAWAWGVGLTAGALLPFLSYPFDTLRRRMMMRSGEREVYSSTRDCLSYIYRTEGYRALWKGMMVNIVKTISGIVVFHLMDAALMNAPR